MLRGMGLRRMSDGDCCSDLFLSMAPNWLVRDIEETRRVNRYCQRKEYPPIKDTKPKHSSP